MTALHVAIVLSTALLTAAIAVADLARADFVLTNSAEVGVPHSWLPALGTLKLLGAAGLTLGIGGVEAIGALAAGGLTAFFLGAVVAHIRSRVFHNIAFPIAYLALAATSLTLTATR